MTTSIQGIQASSLPNGAHYNFMQEVATAISADTPAATALGAIFTAFTAALATEDAALKVSQKSFLTDDINAADTGRDRFLSIANGVLNAWERHPDPVIAARARRLRQSLRDYGIDPNMQLDKETGLLSNLITDWQGPLREDVAALALTETVEAMRVKNEEVKTLVARRADEYTLRYSHNLRAARLATDEAYRTLIRRINAYLEIGADDTFTALAGHLNTRIISYKQQVLRQPTSVRGGSTSTAPSTPSTPPSGGGDNTGDGDDVLS